MKKILTLSVLLSKEIEHLLESDGYKEGQPLPSERTLSERFSVQRPTIRGALQILIQKGLIVSKERQGYFVASKRLIIDLNEFKSTKRYMEQMGKESYVKLLEFERMRISFALAQRLMLPEGSEVYSILRLRYDNTQPMSLERSYVVCEFAGDLKVEDVHNKSLYNTLKRKYNISISHANQKVTVVFASGLEAELLKVSLSKSLMKYEGLVYDKQDRLIEYFKSIMLIEKVEFISNVSVS